MNPLTRTYAVDAIKNGTVRQIVAHPRTREAAETALAEAATKYGPHAVRLTVWQGNTLLETVTPKPAPVLQMARDWYENEDGEPSRCAPRRRAA